MGIQEGIKVGGKGRENNLYGKGRMDGGIEWVEEV